MSSSWAFNVKNGKIIDELNRRVVFHGVNVVEKVGEHLPSRTSYNVENSMVKEDAVFLQSLGMNVMRLGVMWPAVMPSEGYVNTTYLAEVKALMEDMYDQGGIYTLVDMHQVRRETTIRR